MIIEFEYATLRIISFHHLKRKSILQIEEL